MMQFLKSRLPDWVLCVLMSASLSSAVCSGFDMDSPDCNSIAALFILAACVTAVMMVLSYTRLLTGIGIAVGAVIAVASIAYIQSAQPLADEAANSVFIFVLIGIIAGVLVYLLCRTRLGIIVLFIGGNIVGAGAHFLQFENPLWSFVVFTAAVLVIFMYRVYMISLLHADMGRVRTGKYMRQTAAVCLAAVLIASGIFAGIVRPLNPPVHDLKLIRILKQMEMLEVLGIYDVSTVLNPFLNSTETPDRSEISNNEGEEENEDIKDEDKQEQSEEQDTQTDISVQEKVDAVWYDFTEYSTTLLLIPLIVIIAAAAAYWAATRRKRWRREVQKLSHEDAVFNYYNYFLRSLAVAGLRKAPQHTLAEFSEISAHELEMFDTDDVRFGDLSQIYEKTVYGRLKVSDEDYARFEKYFDNFAAGLRRRLGRFKYCLNYLRF